MMYFVDVNVPLTSAASSSLHPSGVWASGHSSFFPPVDFVTEGENNELTGFHGLLY